MGGRFARDDEVAAWKDDGWVLLEGLVTPTTSTRPSSISGTRSRRPRSSTPIPRRTGRPGAAPRNYVAVIPRCRRTGPAFRPEQHRSRAQFPFYGSGELSRLCVHPGVVDFMERALETTDLRVYQAQISAKYAGDANFEQPMHTDRNHSFLPPRMEAPWWHVESFLYLSDVDEGPRRPISSAVRIRSVVRRTAIFMPDGDPELYADERAAAGRARLAARLPPRRVPPRRRPHAPGSHRYLLNVSYKVAGNDWIGYHSVQSNATHPAWTQFVESSTPRELELFGFPPPGSPGVDRRRSSMRRKRSIRSST